MRHPPALLAADQFFYLGFALPIALYIRHWKHSSLIHQKATPYLLQVMLNAVRIAEYL